MEGVVRLRYRLMQLLRRHWMLGTAAFVALVSMFVSFSMSLFGLLRNVKPAKRRMERNHD